MSQSIQHTSLSPRNLIPSRPPASHTAVCDPSSSSTSASFPWRIVVDLTSPRGSKSHLGLSDVFTLSLVIVILIIIPLLAIFHQYKSYDLKKEKVSKVLLEGKEVREKDWTKKQYIIYAIGLVLFIIGMVITHNVSIEVSFAYGLAFWPIFLFFTEPYDGLGIHELLD